MPAPVTVTAGSDLTALPASFASLAGTVYSAGAFTCSVNGYGLFYGVVLSQNIDAATNPGAGNGIIGTLASNGVFMGSIPALNVPGLGAATFTGTLTLSASSSDSSAGATTTTGGPLPVTATPRTAATVKASATAQPATFGTSKGLSPGAVGGVAIGCIVGTALVVGFLTWFIMRRRLQNLAGTAGSTDVGTQKAQPASPTSHQGGLLALKLAKAGVAEVAVSPIPEPSAGFLRRLLPVDPDDGEVKSKVFGVLDGASIHVDNFYADRPSMPFSLWSTDLTQQASPLHNKTLGELLQDTSNATVLITYALTALIVNAITPRSDDAGSLLPPGLGPLLSASQSTKLGDSVDQQEADKNLLWWRLLTMHLSSSATKPLSSPPSRASIVVPNTSQMTTKRDLASNFQRMFRPWLRTEHTETEGPALQRLLEVAADVGVWIQSQRSGFDFRWDSDLTQNTSDRIKVGPALVKKSDQHGKTLATPLVVLEPEIRQLRKR